MYLHWEGRRGYRTRMPAPRVLNPVPDLSVGEGAGNRVIEGDNLQVMVSLRSQYQGSIDIAYLDPPYNTGKRDFAYSDARFHDPNADADDSVYVNNEDGGRHTKWLNFVGPRLWLTWQLLAEHGVCFVSINDIELYRLGLLMDEIFGEQNRLGILVWKQATDNNPTRIATEHEYILCYAKRADALPDRWVGISPAKEWLMETYEEIASREKDAQAIEKEYRAAIRAHQAKVRDAKKEGREGEVLDLGRMARYRNVNDQGPWAKDWQVENPRKGGYDYDILHPETGKVCKKPPKGYRFSEETMASLLERDMIVFGKDHTEPPQLRRYLSQAGAALRSVIQIPGRLGGDRLKEILPEGAARFPNPKPVELIEMLIEAAGDIDALVLDPFAGSGTTGHAVMRLNARDGGVRRFILIEEGTKDDCYARTLMAPRLKAAIEKEDLPGEFTFEAKGQRLNRDAILELEREAIANLIIQTDATGVGRGITPVSSEFVIGHNTKQEAICLCWHGRTKSAITDAVLAKMFAEVKELGLRRPIRAYGATCTVGETDSFRFCQIPDEIIAALQLEGRSDALDGDAEAVERLEAATLVTGE